MSMRRLVIVALTGILALGATATAVILWATSEAGGEVVRTSDPPTPGAVATGAPRFQADGGAPPLPPEMSLRVPSSAMLPPEQGAWEQIRPLTKPIAPLVRALASPVAPCFDEETQARFGPRPHSSLSDATGADPGTATLMLQMEAVEGGLRIIDAPVASLGASSDGLVACAQQVLRGRTVPLPQLQYQPGDRVTMTYKLLPVATTAPVAPAGPGTAPAPAAAQTFRRQRGKTPQSLAP
jgi:hypothetical protein